MLTYGPVVKTNLKSPVPFKSSSLDYPSVEHSSSFQWLENAQEGREY